MYLYCKQRAFTLTELIVTIAVLAIIVMFALPYYHKLKENQEVTQVYSFLKQHIILAKNHASTSHNAVVMCSSEFLNRCEINQWHKGILLFTDLNNNQSIDNNEPIIASMKTDLRYGSLKLKNNSTTTNTIIFRGDTGLPRGAMGGFHYCSFNNSKNYKYFPVGQMANTQMKDTGVCP